MKKTVKPVKKFGGGMLKKVIEQVGKSVLARGGAREANPGVISRPSIMGIGLSGTSTATPQGGPQLTTEQKQQLLRKIMAAKMGRPMKKGGAVKKTAKKK